MPSAAFLIKKETLDKEQCVVFRISVPMGYMDSTAFFCTYIETVKDKALENLDR